MPKTTIKCPNCQTEIDVNEILYHQLEDELKQKSLMERQKLEEENRKREEALEKKFESLQAQEEKFEENLKT